MNPLALWRRLSEWGKALVIALGLLGAVHLFVLRWVTVESTSMYATLQPGDLVGVARWAKWTGFHRGDILVFHDPVQDDRPMRQRRLLVKRIAAIPGDRMEIRQGGLFINGLACPPVEGQTSRWTVRMREGAEIGELLDAIGLPPDLVLPGHTVFDLPLNAGLAEWLLEQPGIEAVFPASSSGKARGHLFPYGPGPRWSHSEYGPLDIPKAGDTVDVNAVSLPLYDRIISRYEGNRLTISGGEIEINGQRTDRYVIRQDYYFVLGDSRDHSEDSRYWGFVPADHAMGRASFVLLNARSWAGHPVQGRTFKSL